MSRYASRSWRSFDPQSAAAAPTPLQASLPRRILGLDPGSIRTGYGVIECRPEGDTHIASGCIQPKGSAMASRLRQIHEGIAMLVAKFCPEEIAIERVFMHRNPDSALKLGQARGAALAAAVVAGAEVFEYAPRAVKLAVVGTGTADKDQVSHMVQSLLGIAEPVTADASDALAIAMCHSQARRSSVRIASMGMPQ
jgi:crossover junction endodeoxyribonuclease RuvC